ncbi:MAG TPA: zinc ribbon domain-containing protein [Thermoanaerobaculia bacterium]|nr:zinc ribbon domain-containing protein [Thermoanaerobaculia bacterium]
MPLYEYECLTCGKRTERLQRFADAPLAACPSCGGEVKKLISSPAFQFKGTGWYATDYAKKGGGGSGAKSEKSEKSEGKGDDSGQSEAGAAYKAEKADKTEKADKPKETVAESKSSGSKGSSSEGS